MLSSTAGHAGSPASAWRAPQLQPPMIPWGRLALPAAPAASAGTWTQGRRPQHRTHRCVHVAASQGFVARPPARRRRYGGAVVSHALPKDDLAIEEMAIMGEYDAVKNAAVWGMRPVPVITRLIKIGTELLSWQIRNPDDPKSNSSSSRGGGSAASAIQLSRSSISSSSARQVRRAAAMRELLVRLGPAFVKIGQALSSRPDILPPTYLVELEALQDRIPAFDSQEAFQVIEKELGMPLTALFSQISAEPVAAASLGQVYKAVTRNGGQEVAIKVQRPGVAEAIALDVYILRWLAAAFRKLRNLNTDLPALVDEWATSLFRELDYRREARNAERFKELYSELEGVYVPTVYKELTTAKVLTMEWVDGERLRTVADNLSAQQPQDSSSAWGPGMLAGRPAGSLEPRARREADLALVEVGVRCSLEQMLEQGFYHADPHPGNLLRTRDGRLAYLDFGMCGELDRKTRQALIRATLHLVNREYNSLAQDFIDLGLLPPGSDKATIVPALTGVFQQALSRGVSNVSFGDLSGELGRTMYQFSFRIPPYYTLLVRSLSVLEGIALASDPNYKVLGSAYPWIARRLLTNQTPELQSTLRQLLYTPGGSFRFSRLDSLLQEAVRTPRALPPPVAVPTSGAAGFTSVVSANSSSSAVRGDPLALLLTPDASFVRNILLDEMAKGIDAGWRMAVDTAVHNALHPLPVAARIPVVGSLLVPLLAPFTTTSNNNWGFNSNYQQDAREPHLAGPAGAVLAALPQLASPQDKEQLEGIQKLTNALSGLANASAATTTSSYPAAAGSSNGVPARVGPGGLSRSPALGGAGVGISTSTSQQGASGAGVLGGGDALNQLQQAVAGLRWLVSEVLALPPAQQAEAMRLPSELAARVTSRVTARALRSVFAGDARRTREPEDVMDVYTQTIVKPSSGTTSISMMTPAEMSPAPAQTPPPSISISNGNGNGRPVPARRWGEEVVEVVQVENTLAGSSIV